jgi:uracil phosphoribosyltransferase
MMLVLVFGHVGLSSGQDIAYNYATKGKRMPDNTQLIDHPLIQHKLAMMRDKDTSTQEFRALLREISMLMGYEILRNLQMEEIVIETPLEVMKARKLSGKKLCIMPILRAGLGFVDGLLDLVPAARVGHIGLYRDPATLEAIEYYRKFPEDLSNRLAIVVDPMLATGNSAVAAVDYVKAAGAADIRFLCLIAVPEGLKTFHAAHPDVPVYTAAIDRELNEHGYILPGIGDAGDRIFGTK